MKIRVAIKMLLVAALILSAGCKKGSGNSDQKEENLIIDVDPPTGGLIVKSLGSTYSFNLIVKSKLPTQGIKIKVMVTKESDNSVVYSQASETNASTTALSINNLPFNEITNVVIEASSKSTPSNSTSLSFKLAKK